MQVKFVRTHNGSYRTRVDGGILLMLDRHEQGCATGPFYEADVMLIRPLYPRTPDQSLDYSNGPYGYLVRPVTEGDQLVRHNGFECFGSMCQTTAAAKIGTRSITLTPGRMHGGGIYVADNVNADFYKSPPMPRVPGIAYVKQADIANGLSVIRIEGLVDLHSTVSSVQSGERYKEWLVRHNAWVSESNACKEAARAAQNRLHCARGVVIFAPS